MLQVIISMAGTDGEKHHVLNLPDLKGQAVPHAAAPKASSRPQGLQQKYRFAQEAACSPPRG